MTYALFLDDERDPPLEIRDRCKVARSVAEALDIVYDHGVPTELYLDHDLGDGKPTSMLFLRWFINQHFDGKLSLYAVNAVTVISANPVGADNLVGLWNSFANNINITLYARRAPATDWKRA